MSKHTVELILLNYGNRVLDVANNKENPTLGELVDTPKRALLEAVLEAVGDKEYGTIDYSERNKVRKEIRENIKELFGGSNE